MKLALSCLGGSYYTLTGRVIRDVLRESSSFTQDLLKLHYFFLSLIHLCITGTGLEIYIYLLPLEKVGLGRQS